MVAVTGRNRVNRPYFFTDVDGERVEFPSFGTGAGDLEGHELAKFRMYVRARQIDEAAAEAPDAFTAPDWDVEAIEDGISVSILALPNDNNFELTGIAIRIDGGDVTIVDPEIGDYPIELDPGGYDVEIAALSDAGQSEWSDTKQVEVE